MVTRIVPLPVFTGKSQVGRGTITATFDLTYRSKKVEFRDIPIQKNIGAKNDEFDEISKHIKYYQHILCVVWIGQGSGHKNI